MNDEKREASKYRELCQEVQKRGRLVVDFDQESNELVLRDLSAADN